MEFSRKLPMTNIAQEARIINSQIFDDSKNESVPRIFNDEFIHRVPSFGVKISNVLYIDDDYTGIKRPPIRERAIQVWGGEIQSKL